MMRKIARVTALTLAVLIVSELIGLSLLRHNVANYAAYWRGRAEQPGEFVYVAIGDSAAQGVGASQPRNGYIGLIAGSIERKTGRKVQVVNLSVTGAKLDDALKHQIPKIANYKPNLVTAEIGANDMGSFDSKAFAVNYDRFLHALPAGSSVVSNMPYFGTRPQVQDNARAANQIIQRQTKQHNIPMADLYGNLQGKQSPLIYASDWFHPNDRGYKVWYEAFWPQVEGLLTR
jgi:acyl-CoA thioesterase-1